MLNGNEASQRREVIVMHPHCDKRETYRGDQVYSITEKGIVIAVMSSRIFYPWSRVIQFTYHNDDVNARKVIQGY